MPGDSGVMVLFQNLPPEILVPGDYDLTPEVQEPAFGMPFGASRGPGARNFEQLLRGKRDGLLNVWILRKHLSDVAENQHFGARNSHTLRRPNVEQLRTEECDVLVVRSYPVIRPPG